MLRRIRLCAAVFTGFAGWLSAQAVVVTGTGDPNVDVPAVQAAVDQGGRVVLMGHFSFDQPPNTPPGAPYSRMVTLSTDVSISGRRDENGDMATIEGGFIPFYAEAPGARLAIQGLRFVLPKGAAIFVYAASGLVISGCRIEGVEASPDYGRYAGIVNPLSAAIFVGSTLPPPTAAKPGQPENFSGTLSILNNDIDTGGTAGDQTIGIVVFSVGKSPDSEVDLYVSGNNVSNDTERSIDVNSVGGRVYIERNVIRTGAIAGPSNGVQPDVIHAVGSGSYLIAHNSIASGWGAGACIRVQGNAGLSETSAVVVDNDVTTSAPEGTVFGANSAAIEIRGFAQNNLVANNRIRGRARAALAVVVPGAGITGNNTFVMNDLTGFQSSLADVFVDAGVTNTIVVEPKNSVEDHGAGTVVVPGP